MLCENRVPAEWRFGTGEGALKHPIVTYGDFANPNAEGGRTRSRDRGRGASKIGSIPQPERTRPGRALWLLQ